MQQCRKRILVTTPITN